MSGQKGKPSLHTGAIIPAAGTSQRLGKDKLFAPLLGRPLLSWTVALFENSPLIDEIVLVAHAQNLERVRALVKEEGWAKVSQVRLGGQRRQDSVATGLAFTSAWDWVIIHDGSRPCLQPELIERGLAEALESGAAIPAVPVADTIKVVGADGLVRETPERSQLWAAQTPQVFRRDIIQRAYAQARDGVTDDASLVEKLGLAVKVFTGSPANIKVTVPQDLALAELILRERIRKGVIMPRVGIGYDVHRLASGRALVLGGVTVPFERGLLGHSDGDVLTHAIMDALLGAAGLSDIGHHFPTDAPQYRDISSLLLLEKVRDMLAERGWQITNIDVSLVGERPRISPYIEQMRQRLARSLGVEPEQIGIKATTSEGLGFAGRGEGMAAWAVATIEKG